jgi:hypothetical protein
MHILWIILVGFVADDEARALIQTVPSEVLAKIGRDERPARSAWAAAVALTHPKKGSPMRTLIQIAIVAAAGVMIARPVPAQTSDPGVELAFMPR